MLIGGDRDQDDNRGSGVDIGKAMDIMIMGVSLKVGAVTVWKKAKDCKTQQEGKVLLMMYRPLRCGSSISIFPNLTKHQKIIHKARNCDIILVYLCYGIYNSPNPSSFLQCSPPIMRCTSPQTNRPEDSACLAIVLTSEKKIGQGATSIRVFQRPPTRLVFASPIGATENTTGTGPNATD
jgi:hypothetical protein